MAIFDRLQHAWNAFKNRDPTVIYDTGPGYYRRPDRIRLSHGNDRSIVTSVFNRIAMDAAAISIKHCRVDDENRYISDIKSGLNNCLNVSANTDQTGRAFIQDVVFSLLDEGCVAIVPVETNINPETQSYDILSLRVGEVIQWYPAHVRVRVYNEYSGKKEEITLPKQNVAIIENPLYAVINEPNSTVQRLMRKLSLLDIIDEQSASGKLDLIVQLPYVIKSDARRAQAEARRKDIENQLTGSRYGIAYTDGTEKITQLNRSVENSLPKRVEDLTQMFYSQLGLTQSILEGTATEQEMLNYYSRTIEPIMSAITDEIYRKFLTKTARSQRQSIQFFRDPFKLVPINSIAEIADKFTRNEILTSNEIRQIIGRKPSDDPKADELVNSNIAQPEESSEDYNYEDSEEKNQNE